MSAIDDLLAKRKREQEAEEQDKSLQPFLQKDEIGPTETFVRSFINSPLQLIGVEPPRDLQKAQAEHPVAGFTGDVAGMAIPYLGWARVAGKVKPLAAAMEKVGSAEKLTEAPFKARFAKEFVRFAPFEGARIAGAAVFGGPLAESLDREFRGTADVAQQAVLDLGLGGALAGGFQLYKAAGPRFGRRGQAPGADLGDPVQLRVRQMEKALTEGRVADVDLAQAAIHDAERLIKRQNPVGNKAIELADKEGTLGLEFGGSSKALNRIWRPAESKYAPRMKFTVSSKGAAFRSVDEMKAKAAESGLEGNWAYVQYPRYMKVEGTGARESIPDVLKRNMKSLDSSRGWFYEREKGSGLFVMAREFKPGEWVLFKTDSPQRFVPEFAKHAQLMELRSAVFGLERGLTKPLGEGAEVANAGIDFYNNVPMIDTRGLKMPKGKIAEVTNKIIKGTGLDKTLGEGAQAGAAAWNFTKKYLSPAMFQFTHPAARKAFQAAKIMHDAAEGLAEKLFLGGKTTAGRPTLLGDIFHGAVSKEGGNSIKALVRAASQDKDSWTAVWRTVNTNSSIESGIKEFGLTKEGVALLKRLQEIDAFQIKGLQEVQAAVGEKLIQPMQHHYMISRTWKGQQRVPILEGNKVIGYAAHTNRRGALDEAQAIVNKGLEEGRSLRIGVASTAGDLDQDLRLLQKIGVQDAELFGKLKDRIYLSKRTPKRAVTERKGLEGYVGETKPWTPEEFEKHTLGQLRDYQKYIAKLSHKKLVEKDLSVLRTVDPDQYEQVVHRINSLFGEMGQFSRQVNKFADTLLGPVLGKDTATKVVGEFNKWNFRFTLGFANMGYAIANTLTFVQTAYPQLAFLTTAAPERIAQYYHYWPVQGAKSMNAIGVLDMMKLTKKSFQLLGKPDEQLRRLFARGAAEGVWDPKFVEEFVGESANTVVRLKDTLKGDQPFSKWLAAVADVIPSFSEKFARGHTFVLGRTFFKDIMGIEDEELLYQMTKQFVEKTQFLYSTGDRARIITGPLGSAFGLFKNWIMHYMGWMMEYTGQGVLHGNWKPLLWSMGSTTAIGGIGALPFYGAADNVSKWASDKSLMQNTYELFGGTDREGLGSVADAVHYGLPAFLNFSIQNQVAAPGVNFGQDAARFFSLAYVDRMKYLGLAAGSAWDSMTLTGENPMRNDQTRDLLMRALAPKTVYRIAQSTQSEVLKSLSTGNAIAEQTMSERFMYGLGVNPRWVESRYAVGRELWENQEKMKVAVQTYGERWAQAFEDKDWNAMRNVIYRAIYEGVDVSSVIKSGKARLAKGQEEVIDRQFKPEEVLKWRRLGLQ